MLCIQICVCAGHRSHSCIATCDHLDWIRTRLSPCPAILTYNMVMYGGVRSSRQFRSEKNVFQFFSLSFPLLCWSWTTRSTLLIRHFSWYALLLLLLVASFLFHFAFFLHTQSRIGSRVEPMMNAYYTYFIQFFFLSLYCCLLSRMANDCGKWTVANRQPPIHRYTDTFV